MNYHTLEKMRRTHPGWRLLASDHAPLVASFLHNAFIAPNVRSYGQGEIAARLDDLLFALREGMGEASFPRTALQYLDDWAGDEKGWLRKYYVHGSDEPRYDMTAQAEKAVDWLVSLGPRPFVGTESRLLTIFELLRQMLEGAEIDPALRIRELEKRRARIDAEIEAVREGRAALMDPVLLKDRFLQVEATARGILSDFRELDQNFRELYRSVRERIATWEEGKGALMGEIFGERDAIVESDQGRSFRAFWDFLMTSARQEELSDLLEKAFALDPVRALNPDARLLRIHFDWMAGGETVQRTVANLSAELRRYLDDKAWLENRRVMQLIREVEQKALQVRECCPPGPFMELSESAPAPELPMDRLLFAPPIRPRLRAALLEAGAEEGIPTALFREGAVDPAELRARVRRELSGRSRISLGSLLALYPLDRGLEELVAYFTLASEDGAAVIDERQSEEISWETEARLRRSARIPLVLFVEGR